MSGTTVSPNETTDELVKNLDDGNYVFQCNKCGHYVGDSRDFNWLGECPACERYCKFFRLIE